MQALVENGEATSAERISWNDPHSWLRQYRFSRSFWTFFLAALFFDAGFGIYYFLFNLFLLNLHFQERSIGLINGALTLGSVACTLPAGMLARKYGVRPVMLACLAVAPAVGVLRTLFTQLPSQIALALLGGAAMCLWGVCFLPAIAELTEENNRAAAFSLIFSVSVGTSALGGAFAAHLPAWMAAEGSTMLTWQIQRAILICASLLAAVAFAFAWRLRLPNDVRSEDEPMQGWKHLLHSSFLRRYIPLMAIWSAMIAAFVPFANVYLTNSLHLSLSHIGTVFLLSQLVQLCSGLVTAPLFRSFGLQRGIAATQLVTGTLLMLLALTHTVNVATVLYLCFSATQWMSSPGMYNLLMRGTPDSERSTAASAVMFGNALVSSGATALAGIGFANFGYAWMFVLLGLVAVAVAVCTVTVLRLPQEVQA
ncbi:MFS transporter [Terriglobus roseus]|uniref:Predicted arabinose efflux permease, MFS family n=1 Tax=Terriglobus roseus TaxID=392734 RepID=A0A1G7KJB6_9BACT|nr:MFS transporter [Terriglobus roseus]SDF37287.1 Predicted arabinose efflux permease, MFS family [Terriglobus roseus]